MILPSSQQSNEDDPAAQLSVPHTRSPAQWESESQSPSPRLQGEEEVQQERSSFAGSQGTEMIMSFQKYEWAKMMVAWSL